MRTFLLLWLTATAAVGLAPAAWAGDLLGSLPFYDSQAECTATAGANNDQLQSCLQREQAARDELQDRWGGLPAAMRATCDEEAQQNGPAGSYVLLKNCITEQGGVSNH
jgi:hypothetical protein